MDERAVEIPAAGYYNMAILGGEPVFLVGQGWGAAITYNVVTAFPELMAPVEG